MAHKTFGALRIAALPLTRTQPRITYHSFRVITPPSPSTSDHEKPQPKGWLPREGVVKWATHKADNLWVSWGKAPERSWKFRLFEFGERFLDRLDFEEGALKKIDIHHAPPSSPPLPRDGVDEKEQMAAWEQLEVPLLYPPGVYSGSAAALSDLRSLVERRIPLHNRGFYTFLIIAPLTAPFMIIPVIPNIPFFFCAWRAWSHYQALRGARHVEGLLKHQKIVPRADGTLNAAYPEIDPLTSGDGPALAVTRDSLGKVIQASNMEPDDAKDLLRAYEQATIRQTPR